MQKHLIICLLLLGAGFLAYGSSLRNNFILDDPLLIDQVSRNPESILRYFDPAVQKFCYRPMLGIALTLQYGLFDIDPFGYHLTNLILLCGCGFLLYLLLLGLYGDRLLAASAGLLFVLHPFNSIYIYYVSTINVLLGLGFMLAALLFLKQTQKVSIALAVAFFMAALCCHEMSLLLPVLAAFLYGWRRSVSLWAVLAVYLLWQTQFAHLNSNLLAHFAEFQMNPVQFLASGAQLLAWYLAKFFIPSGIVFTWGVPVERALAWAWCLGLLIFLAGGIYGLVKLPRTSVFRFSIVCLGGSSILLLFGSVAKPHWFLIIEPYWLPFALIGLCLGLAQLIVSSGKKAWPAAAVILIMWAVTDNIYARLWSNEKKYCYFWLEHFPGYKQIHNYLARAYSKTGDYEIAREHNLLSLSEHPQDRFNYLTDEGLLAIKQGRWKDAKKSLNKALEMSPRSGRVLANLGVVAIYERDLDKAKEYFQQALNEAPSDVLTRANLAALLVAEGRIEEAIKLYEYNLTFLPGDNISLVRLIQIYTQRNDRINMLRIARHMLRHSDNPLILKNASIILGQDGN